MASRFRVEWTRAAATDLSEIIVYIAKDSPSSASKIYQQIRRRVSTLKNFPGRGHVVPEFEELQIVSYRELSAPPFRIIYRIDGRRVFVHAVLDGR